jgi:hypothetical protein
MENEKQKQNDDEISLMDLFMVLLRYRKLIIGITLFSVLLAVAGYFFYPEYQYNRAMDSKLNQGIMQMETVQRAVPYIPVALNNFILNAEIIYDSLLAAEIDYISYKGENIYIGDSLSETDKKDRASNLYLIRQFWIKNMDINEKILFPKDEEYKKTFSVKMTDSIASIILNNQDGEKIKIFFETLFRLTVAKVEEYLRVNAQVMVDNYERIMNLPKISESMQMILEKDFDAYNYMCDFLAGKETVVKMVNEPMIVEPVILHEIYRKGYNLKGVIIVFAGFFAAICLSFFLNALHNIRNDEETMKKIKDALGNSGSK